MVSKDISEITYEDLETMYIYWSWSYKVNEDYESALMIEDIEKEMRQREGSNIWDGSMDGDQGEE